MASPSMKKKMSKPSGLSRHKAAEILEHGSVRGKKLTGKQKRYMYAVKGGKAKKGGY